MAWEGNYKVSDMWNVLVEIQKSLKIHTHYIEQFFIAIYIYKGKKACQFLSPSVLLLSGNCNFAKIFRYLHEILMILTFSYTYL